MDIERDRVFMCKLKINTVLSKQAQWMTFRLKLTFTIRMHTTHNQTTKLKLNGKLMKWRKIFGLRISYASFQSRAIDCERSGANSSSISNDSIYTHRTFNMEQSIIIDSAFAIARAFCRGLSIKQMGYWSIGNDIIQCNMDGKCEIHIHSITHSAIVGYRWICTVYNAHGIRRCMRITHYPCKRGWFSF